MGLIASLILVGLSLLLGLRLLAQYVKRPRPHTLWYAVGLLFSAVAAFPELYFSLTDSLPTFLWWTYWVAASTLVGFLGVGTAYLLSRRFGHIALTSVLLLAVWLAVVTVMTAGAPPEPLSTAAFQKAPTAMIKLPFLIQNIAGSLVILIGALISFVKTRGMYAILIALGTLVFSSGGALTGLLDFPGVFAFTQAAGIILLYLGVSKSVGPKRAGSVSRAG